MQWHLIFSFSLKSEWEYLLLEEEADHFRTAIKTSVNNSETLECVGKNCQWWEARNLGITLGPAMNLLRVAEGLQVHCEICLWFSFHMSYLPILPHKPPLTVTYLTKMDSNRPTHRNARHPSRTIFPSISWRTSGSWWPRRSWGSSLSLVPLAQQKNNHQKFALEASATQKYIFPERTQDKFKEATVS